MFPGVGHFSWEEPANSKVYAFREKFIYVCVHYDNSIHSSEEFKPVASILKPSCDSARQSPPLASRVKRLGKALCNPAETSYP